MISGNRFDFKTIRPNEFWADGVADAVIAKNPSAELYTCAAGISPSGIVHFGNFRDIITSYTVAQALKRKGKNVRILFSWDNFDRYRKVPAGIDPSFEEHIGKALSKIPDPCGNLSSYAERFQTPFEEAVKELGIELVFKNQTELHEAGTYDEAIFHALRKKYEIADILLSFMTEKGKENKNINPTEYREKYYPISVYSRFTGKDNTTVLSYDGESTITYLCRDTNQTETVDLSKEHIAKLSWKIDWAMRWKHEDVSFEPGGSDHAAPGGSYDTASEISEKIFGYEPPTFTGYEFIGIQGLGTKMSGSKGNAVSPKELLSIYDPILLKWLYLRRSPQQPFQLAFDSEIYRQYDEFDRDAERYFADKEADPILKNIFDYSIGSLSDATIQKPIPFRYAVAYGQITQWDTQKLVHLLEASDLSYSNASIETRLPLAKEWLTKYNSEEIICLREKPNKEYFESLDEKSQRYISTLRTVLQENTEQTIKELELLVYSIPKEEGIEEAQLKKDQRTFFKHVYTLLIGKETGPRLSTFLWAIDRNRALELLNFS